MASALEMNQGMVQSHGQTQTLSQTQTQSVSQQQIRQQKFLQTPLVSLNVLMNDYIQDYPLLEIADGNSVDFKPESIDENRTDYDEAVGDSYADACERIPDESNEYDQKSDGDIRSGCDDCDSSSRSGGENNVYTTVDPDQILNNIASTQSVYQELRKQLRLENCPPRLIRAALAIIDSLDGRGILSVSLDSIASETQCSMKDVESALKLIQGFDPAGVGARSMQESLLLQLDRNGITDGPAVTLLRDHYALLEQNNMSAVCAAMGISEPELQEIFHTIRHNSTPAPLGNVGSEPTVYIVPEVRVIEGEDGEYVVEPVKDRLPELYIKEEYLQQLEDKTTDKALRDYIRKNLDGLREFRNMLEQRGSTIVQIARQLVSAQYDYVRDGNSALKPLTMDDVAARINCNQSTVSRAIAGKYMDTPRGTLSFSSFFHRGVTTESGEQIVTDNVKKILRELIDNEDRSHPLSDAKLTDMLAEQGINLSRRVIAKYRDQLGIKNSAERRIRK